MFIKSLSASDPRFKRVEFHQGLNILLADRSEASDLGDTRNSAGKTSAVKILRFLLGGDLADEFKVSELRDWRFSCVLLLPTVGQEGLDEVVVTRGIAPANRVSVRGWRAIPDNEALLVEEWREAQADHLFGLSADVSRPTVPQLWAQLIRTYFVAPTKVRPSETEWETGTRIGHLLGLSPEVLVQAGEVARLSKQTTALKKAVKEGAITHLALDESKLRARLSNARRNREKLATSLKGYRVEEKYAEHQQRADEITGRIQELNVEGLALQRRRRELEETLAAEVEPSEEPALKNRLRSVYAELGVALPEALIRRFEEVEEFHASVIRNRRSFLGGELESVEQRLSVVSQTREHLDEERRAILALLEETVALDTFVGLQRELGELEGEIADLDRKLASVSELSRLADNLKLRTAEVISTVRAELDERTDSVDDAIATFGELGTEIYTDRESTLLITPNDKGALKITPQISGDASTGVSSVEAFILDMVCVKSSLREARSPGFLCHDSHLFDAIDGRQVASCLNIGARLADELGFQYLVTLNSDFLESAVAQSDGAFDSEPYILPVTLTDTDEEGGLFGFRFD